MRRTSVLPVARVFSLLALSAPALSADTPGAAHSHAADPRTVAILLKQGQDAFDANDWNGARDAFVDACTADPANVTAARDLAIIYLELEKPAKATHLLEIAANVKAPDRGLVLAIAVHRVAIKQPMQAIKYLSMYFDAHPMPVDEELLDALGIALAQAETAGVKSALFVDSGKTYKKLNTKLEATRKGEKRWGMDWQPADDVDAKQKSLTGALLTVHTNTATVSKLDAEIADTTRQMNAVPHAEGENNMTKKVDAFQKQIDGMNADRAKYQKEVDDAQKIIDDLKPKWPDAIPLAWLSLAPAITGPAVVSGQPAPGTDATPRTAGAEATAPPVVGIPVTTPDAKPAVQSYHGTRYAAAFAIAPDLLVTASSSLADATDIQVTVSAEKKLKAEVVRADEPSGLTLLRVADAHFTALPIAAAAGNVPVKVKCISYPEVDLFTPVPQEIGASIPVVTTGHPIASVDKLPRIPGGPLLLNGLVVAVEMSDRDSERDAIPIVTLDALKPLLATDASGKAVVADLKNSVFQIAASR